MEMLVFEERRKQKYLEKNLSEQRREPTTNSTLKSHYCAISWYPGAMMIRCSTESESRKLSRKILLNKRKRNLGENLIPR